MTDRNGALSPEVERNLLHELYRREFEAFLEGAFRILEPNTEYIRSGYIGLICDRLLDVSDGDCQRLIVNCPPRHLKSFAISQAFPAWLLGQRDAASQAVFEALETNSQPDRMAWPCDVAADAVLAALTKADQ